MALKAKICGLNHLKAAVLGADVPPGIVKVGLFVDASDEEIARAIAEAPLDMLQLHGDETPRRVKDIRRRVAASKAVV